MDGGFLFTLVTVTKRNICVYFTLRNLIYTQVKEMLVAMGKAKASEGRNPPKKRRNEIIDKRQKKRNQDTHTHTLESNSGLPLSLP